ncbi:NAD(P)/FAD-dependent oxidoreductase [Pseudohalioglobus sediminis]|uniref:NAD(P)/FAD-dependent oxidoreductase n=1 Tax=Pseudohalioglobus sediminis TaxID=2606449 RepID=A0A5B0WU98_9GAMM|nr:NAD(P)/FAD-dependent oxidoreductase [Pseudohalioglobus sediminis]KAA1190662.1 NAD(P)/FAD-dependent oxidoreductase [Pseudohalioglobus sediminis]
MYDVIVIGAGPSGAVASALLVQKGYSVIVLEKDNFPRFSIGESLLPHCMEFIEEAGMTAAVESGGFQKKNGAVFQRQGAYSSFDFREKFTAGPGETFQVKRAEFDRILANEAERLGADIRYQHKIENVEIDDSSVTVTCITPDQTVVELGARFVLDASGFGRVLPRLFDLEHPSDFPVRSSLFCHIEDRITNSKFDRNKILITVHPAHKDVWYWLIPFSDGRCSIGVVAEPEFLDQYPDDLDVRLRSIVVEDPELNQLLCEAQWDTEVRQITGYSADVSTLATASWALLGNAGEFLDPVFSSGVTIALHSASLAAKILDRQLQGTNVDWQVEYAEPLKQGVDTFRAFVTAWYDGRFQDVIFYEQQSEEIRNMISSILAGYAWDIENPYVANPERRLNALWRYCSN